MRLHVFRNVVALGGVALVSVAQEPSAIPALASFSGHWTLNQKLSDDAQQKMRESMERRQPGRFAPGGPGPAGPPPGGGDAPEGIRGIFEPAEEMTIAVRAGEIEIEEAYGTTRRLRPNGKTYKTENGLAELKARWEDGELRVETKRGRRGKVEEKWILSPDRNRIEIQVKLDFGPGSDLSLRRVYDRAATEGEG